MSSRVSVPTPGMSRAARFSARGRSFLLLIALAAISISAQPISKHSPSDGASALPADRGTGPIAASPAPERPCDDAVPPDCKKARFLGEEKGCACFECNPGTKQAKVVCTKDEQKKKDLFGKASESADAGQE